MFIGRTGELDTLSRMYQSDRFEFAVIYGRRRIGKTALIQEFCKDKKTVYYMATQVNQALNLKNFGETAVSALMPEAAGKFSPDSFTALFDFIAEKAQNERLILAIDEYPYLASAGKEISSVLQAAIDQKFMKGYLFLILCGSSMSFMEHQVLGYQSPLYGRRTAQIKLQPFTYEEALPFWSSYGNEDRITAYAVTGGIPDYIREMDERQSVRDNICRLFLNSSGLLFEEPESLLKQELREPAVYNGIIGAIAGGASRLSEIADKARMEASRCPGYLDALLGMGIVVKETPAAEKEGRKTIYRLADHMFRFWYRYVFPNMSAIISGRGEQLYDALVAPSLSEYLSPVFEQICAQYLLTGKAYDEKAPFFIGDVGRWWGNNPGKRRQEEIDLLAAADGGKKLLLGECKWTHKPLSETVVYDLIQKGEDVFPGAEKWYIFFAKEGFTDQAEKVARADDHIRLITFSELNRNCIPAAKSL